MRMADINMAKTILLSDIEKEKESSLTTGLLVNRKTDYRKEY